MYKFIKCFESFNNPKIGYHISPSYNDESILLHGIKPTREDNAYVWLDEGFANWFRETYYGDEIDEDEDWYKPSTKWIINIDGLELKRDPEAEDMNQWSEAFPKGLFGHAYIHKGVIPKERIIGKA